MSYAISEQYDSIHDMVIESKYYSPFRCQIACKQADRKLIEVYDIKKRPKEDNYFKSIIYQNDGMHILVKISDDF